MSSSLPACDPDLSNVSFDRFIGPGEGTNPVQFNIADRGCPVSPSCLACPLVVCKFDIAPNGKEYGFGKAIRLTWPKGDWPAHLHILAQQGLPRDRHATPVH